MEKETSQDTGRPYLEEGEIRTFSETLTEEDLVWHRDPEDRTVIPLDNFEWYYQIDNQLPAKLNKPIFIPKDTYHRIIVGKGDIKVKVIKH